MRFRFNVIELRIEYLCSVHKTYDALSEESKRFFHLGFLGLRSVNMRWLLAQIAFLTSSSRYLRKALIRTYPHAVFLNLVAINQRNEVIGFAFIKVKKGLLDGGFLGELGIFVREDYQGRGVGSKLMNNLIELGRRENVREIYLTVLTDNAKAIHLYKKYGFKKKKTTRGGDIWRGRKYDSIEMRLNMP